MLDKSRFELYKQLNPNELLPHQFQKLEAEIKHPDSKTISDECFDFILWSRGLPSRQESFANFIAKKLSKKKDSKILEVGGGRTGKLSRFLNEKGFTMTCIDPKLEVESSNGITFIPSQFIHDSFDLSPFDYVIAQEPCDATEHVVRACTKQNVPFLMTLCGVPHQLISGKTPNTVSEWYNFLVNIDNTRVKLRYIELDPILSTPILKSNQF